MAQTYVARLSLTIQLCAKISGDPVTRPCGRHGVSLVLSFPVVPQGKARIRTQISAAHTREDLAFAVEKFSEARSELAT